MKSTLRLLGLFALVCLLLIAARPLSAADASPPASAFVIASAPAGSGTISSQVVVARVQGDPAADGALVLTCFLKTVVRDAQGAVITEQWTGETVQVTVPAEMAASLSALIAAARAAPPGGG